MHKHKKLRLIIASIVCMTLLTGSVIISKNSNDAHFYDFKCNTDSTSYRDANEIIEEFAKANNLSVNEWPDEMVELLSKSPETEEFVLNYPLMKDTYQDIDLSEYANTDSVPLFLQWDQRWGYTPYGDNFIANAGCGPTCLSMVCVHLLGDTSLDPRTVAQFSEENGYCVPGDGSQWTLISEGGPTLGLNVEVLPLDEYTIIENLEAGNPIICVMGPGDFTSSGHYIVMTDYVDGMIKINDPNSVQRSKKLWSYEQIKDQINNLWACSAP